MILLGRYCAVAQNVLDHRIINAQAIQIRRQAPAEPVPTVPEESRPLEHIFHFPLVDVRVNLRRWAPQLGSHTFCDASPA